MTRPSSGNEILDPMQEMQRKSSVRQIGAINVGRETHVGIAKQSKEDESFKA